MKIIKVREEDVKEITEFINDNKLIFHPVISPNGFPDFTNFFGRDFILILDRNILTTLLQLCTSGTLNDKYLLRVVSSLMFWAELNNVRVTAGLALNEYANYKNSNIDASRENNIFLKIFNEYSPLHWLEIATGRCDSIPIINCSSKQHQFEFNIESEHYKMHYVSMLHLLFLYNEDISPEERIIRFIHWVNDNILFCQYTIAYATLFFSNNIKQIRKSDISDINKIKKICRNQAWDLTYLSFWSTLYWDDNEEETIFLFSTMDKALKKIFMNTHCNSSDIFYDCFGEVNGAKIQNEFNSVILKRVKPEVDSKNLVSIETVELTRLKKHLVLNNS